MHRHGLMMLLDFLLELVFCIAGLHYTGVVGLGALKLRVYRKLKKLLTWSKLHCCNTIACHRSGYCMCSMEFLCWPHHHVWNHDQEPQWYPFCPFWVLGSHIEYTNRKKGTLIVIWLLGYQDERSRGRDLLRATLLHLAASRQVGLR